MTLEQLATVKWGDIVRYEGRTGNVTRVAPTWFMVTWNDDDVPEIIRRTRSVFTDHLQIVA